MTTMTPLARIAAAGSPSPVPRDTTSKPVRLPVRLVVCLLCACSGALRAETHVSGIISSDEAWTSAGSPYIVDGTVTVYGSANPRLTIEAGVLVQFEAGTMLNIGSTNAGENDAYRGQLNALGTSDSLITFTSLSGAVGDWSGIRFRNCSDYNGAESEMRHCLVEKAAYYNVYCTETSQPHMARCVITDCGGDGLYLSSSPVTVDSCQIHDNGDDGVFCSNGRALLRGCTIEDNGDRGLDLSGIGPRLEGTLVGGNATYGVYASSSSPELWQCEVSGNGLAGCNLAYADSAQIVDCLIADNGGYPVRLDGGRIPELSGLSSWGNEAEAVYYTGRIDRDVDWDTTVLPIPLHVYGSVEIWNSTVPTLTVAPGSTILFASGSSLHVSRNQGSESNSYRGQLQAVGMEDSLITFTSLSGASGDWYGLQFHTSSDYNGAASTMRRCVVERADNYNLLLSATNQPELEDCTIRDGADRGLYLSSSYPVLRSCTFQGNGSDGVYCTGPEQTVIGDSLGASCFFIDNGGHHIRNVGSGEVLARHNVWDQRDSVGVAERIYDHWDYAAYGEVRFMPFYSDELTLWLRVEEGQVILNWSAPMGAELYRLYASDTPWFDVDGMDPLVETTEQVYVVPDPQSLGMQYYMVTMEIAE